MNTRAFEKTHPLFVCLATVVAIAVGAWACGPDGSDGWAEEENFGPGVGGAAGPGGAIGHIQEPGGQSGDPFDDDPIIEDNSDSEDSSFEEDDPADGDQGAGGQSGGGAPLPCNPVCSGETPQCNAAAKRCECTASSCGKDKVCNGGKCIANPTGCTPACGGETPRCNAAAKRCECTDVSCSRDKLCSGGKCVENPNCTVYKVAKVADSTWKNYKKTKKHPASVKVCNRNVSMPSFLALTTAGTVATSKGPRAVLNAGKTYKSATNPGYKSTAKGKVKKANYLNMAGRIKSWMDKNGRAPNYSAVVANSSSVVGYTDLVYVFSAAMGGYLTNRKLPDYVELLQFAPAHSNPLKPILGFAQHNTSSTRGSCGSHAMAVGIAHLRGIISVNQARDIEKAIYKTVPYRPGPASLVTAANKYMTAKKMPYKAQQFSGSDKVPGYIIKRGMPVVANTSQFGGHYVTIYGLVKEGGTWKVYFSDGARNHGIKGKNLPTGYLKKWNWSTFKHYVRESKYVGFAEK